MVTPSFFFNIENTGDLENEVAALETVLSGVLRTNLQAAYKAFMTLAKTEDEYDAAEAELEQYDDVFYENEEEINCILKKYADEIDH